MMTVSFRNAQVPARLITTCAGRMRSYFQLLRYRVGRWRNDTLETSIALCDNRAMVREVRGMANRWISKHPLVIVAGIGGSHLGSQAIYEAVAGPSGWAVDKSNSRGELLFADTVDALKLTRMINEIRRARRQKRTVIMNIISKSGSTTETVMNAAVLKKYAGPWNSNDIVVTTDKGSPLWQQALGIGYWKLEIPKMVGGRYSVFTPVGLFPLALVGIDIDGLLRGARWARELCLRSVAVSPAVKSAAVLYYHATHGRPINDNFFFRTDLESLGKWYRQLMGESIGKDGKGITPTVSIGSTDLHSMAQLYLGGPQDKVTTFVSVCYPERSKAESKDDVFGLPKQTAFGPLVGGVIDGRSPDEVLAAILKGTQTAYAKKGHPFIDVVLDRLDEESIGAFMQWKMIEMMILGKLFGVNAFDQPNVEEYKRVTKRLLQQRSK